MNKAEQKKYENSVYPLIRLGPGGDYRKDWTPCRRPAHGVMRNIVATVLGVIAGLLIGLWMKG